MERIRPAQDRSTETIEEVTLEPAIPDSQLERWFSLYTNAFEQLAIESALRQWMSRDEFYTEMTNSAVTKIVSWDPARNPAALACVTNEPAAVPWLNMRFFQHRFPDEFERKAIFWVGTILVDPDKRGLHHVPRVITRAAQLVLEADGICVFDCCRYNRDVASLPTIIEGCVNQLTPVRATEIDSQHFYAVAKVGTAHTKPGS